MKKTLDQIWAEVQVAIDPQNPFVMDDLRAGWPGRSTSEYLDLLQRQRVFLKTPPSSGGGGALVPHAPTHKNGGNDEVASSTAGPNRIPKANALGVLDSAWLGSIPAGPTTEVLGIGLSSDDGFTTGTKGYRTVPAGRITKWTILADQIGSISFDLKKTNKATWPASSSIVVDHPPVLAGALTAEESPTLWGSFAEGDLIEFVVDSALTVTRVWLTLHILRS